MTVKFNSNESAKVGLWFVKGTEKAAHRAAVAAAAKLVNHIVVDVIPREPHPPIDRGLYRAAWRHRRTNDGAIVFNTAPHAPFIEHGVRAGNVKPGRAMLIALAGWVRRKGIVSGRGKAAITEARQAAFAIAMSMKKRGIFNRGRGLRILEKASRRIERFFKDEYKRELHRALR